MAPDPAPFEAKSLEESEASRTDFSLTSWRLLGLANIDRRDVVGHSDWVRYTAIGTFMVFFTIYAVAGWMTFLSSAGIRKLGSGGLAVEIAAALLGAGATLAFDRALVGTTKPNLDYRTGEVEGGDTAEELVRQSASVIEHDDALPSLVAKSSRGPIAARFLVALIIGVFVTQAVDLKVFAADIDSQRASDQIGELEREQKELGERHKGEVGTHERSVHLATAQLAAAKTREAQAKRGSHEICQRHLFHSNLPSRCQKATESELAAQGELATLAEHDPADSATATGRKYFSRQAAITEKNAELRSHPSHSRSAGGGPSADTAELIRYVAGHPGSIPLYGAVLLLALLLDLAAIMLKLAGSDSEYERRQALRRWRSWTATNTLESLRHAEWQVGVRGELGDQAVQEAAGREATITAIDRDAAQERAYRAAYAQVDRDPGVQRDAHRVALDQIRRQMRVRSPFLREGADPTEAGSGYEPPTPDKEPAGEDDDFGFGGFMAGDDLKGDSGTGWKLVRSHDSHRGAHSTVWEAERVPSKTDAAPGETVKAAIKLMPVEEPGPFKMPLFDVKSERARNELKALERFQRGAPHLPQLLDKSLKPVRGCGWHATAWARRGTLHDYYSHGRPRPLTEILEFARQILVGLNDAGELVHGDLKPANLLLFDHAEAITAPGVPRLVINDWGLARESGQPPGIGHHEIGTIEYAAPNTVDPKRRVHILDDLFSLGAIVWWCVTGSAPGFATYAGPANSYSKPADYAQALAHGCEQLPRLKTLQSNVTDDVSSFVGRLLSPTRNARLLNLDNVGMDHHRSYLNETLRLIFDLLSSTEVYEQQLGKELMVGPTLQPETPAYEADATATMQAERDLPPETNPTGGTEPQSQDEQEDRSRPRRRVPFIGRRLRPQSDRQPSSEDSTGETTDETTKKPGPRNEEPTGSSGPTEADSKSRS